MEIFERRGETLETALLKEGADVEFDSGGLSELFAAGAGFASGFTLAAEGPFGPWVTSNSTPCPSTNTLSLPFA